MSFLVLSSNSNVNKIPDIPFLVREVEKTVEKLDKKSPKKEKKPKKKGRYVMKNRKECYIL